jgi:hypothetical protein
MSHRGPRDRNPGYVEILRHVTPLSTTPSIGGWALKRQSWHTKCLGPLNWAHRQQRLGWLKALIYRTRKARVKRPKCMEQLSPVSQTWVLAPTTSQAGVTVQIRPFAPQPPDSAAFAASTLGQRGEESHPHHVGRLLLVRPRRPDTSLSVNDDVPVPRPTGSPFYEPLAQCVSRHRPSLCGHCSLKLKDVPRCGLFRQRTAKIRSGRSLRLSFRSLGNFVEALRSV